MVSILNRVRSVRVLNTVMVACFLLAIFAYLPFGFSVIGDYSAINILWLSIPSSVGVYETLTSLIIVIGPFSISIALLCLVRTVQLISGRKQIFGRYGIVLLVLGAGSLFLSGVLAAFHVTNSYHDFDGYSILARLAGFTIFASGVLVTVTIPSAIRSFDKRIGMLIMGTGVIFLLPFTGAEILGEVYFISDMDVWSILNGLEVVGISLVMIGIVWVESGLLRSLKQSALTLRFSMVVSLAVLLTGASYLYLFVGPNLGVHVDGPYEWGTMSEFLSYLFTLGILLVLGTAVLMGMQTGRNTIKGIEIG